MNQVEQLRGWVSELEEMVLDRDEQIAHLNLELSDLLIKIRRYQKKENVNSDLMMIESK